MKTHTILTALTVLGLSGATAQAVAGCKLNTVVALPVNMEGLRPMVPAKINGADASFILDSGGFWNMISAAAAAAAATEFKLSLRPFQGLQAKGIGGAFELSSVNVKKFLLAGLPFTDVKFLVGGGDPGGGAVGLLGQNLLRIWDVDYDLANSVVKLVQSVDCADKPLVYWSQTQPYSVVKINGTTELEPHTAATMYVNGAAAKVVFDTGAPTSFMTLRTAARAGIKPDSPGVVDAGYIGGLGREGAKTWIASFADFKIGDEEIRNARVRFADIRSGDFDLLLGADFFLSHHIFVATSQGKMYFTYNGGPVFNLNRLSAPEAAAISADEGAQKSDAADLARRGSALAARRDFVHAIAELTRACELQPNEPQYFYERGMANLDNGEVSLAGADFDQVLKLRPNDLPALVARARLHFDAHDRSQGIADLDAADRAAPKEADVRLQMAALYESSKAFASAISQYDRWIAVHDVDGRRAGALGSRCRNRAMLGLELNKALVDCNSALDLHPHEDVLLESRGLVHLRRGDLNSSIWDFNAVIKSDPHAFWAFYGRGIARIRKGKTAEGQADIKAAEALHPGITGEATERGLPVPGGSG
jgi:tetratricopeptide (TPR) repeat protein/predicted aspartyl protease